LVRVFADAAIREVEQQLEAEERGAAKRIGKTRSFAPDKQRAEASR
jgi:hypothetical protein